MTWNEPVLDVPPEKSAAPAGGRATPFLEAPGPWALESAGPAGQDQGMAPLSLIVIGGFAGALHPLMEIASGLPPDLPAAVLVVLHLAPDHPSLLPELLSRSGPLPARHARDGDVLRPGVILVAPPDHHLLAGPGEVRVSHGLPEHRSRPSIDLLFRSAAHRYGRAVIGVVLSGMLDDGASGLWTIKRFGGRAIVQHPDDAEFSSMPLSALRSAAVDHVLPARQIAGALRHLTTGRLVAGPDLR